MNWKDITKLQKCSFGLSEWWNGRHAGLKIL